MELYDQLLKRQAADNPIRVGLVGCGQMGSGMVHVTNQMAGMKTVAIADIDVNRPLKTFRKIGVDRVANPGMNVIILDHVTPAANETYAQSHRETREFVREQGISAFYDVGQGICHQVLPEEGHALPGMLIVGSDSHTPSHGALGAFAAGIGRTEAAAVMATGEIWLRVP